MPPEPWGKGSEMGEYAGRFGEGTGQRPGKVLDSYETQVLTWLRRILSPGKGLG